MGVEVVEKMDSPGRTIGIEQCRKRRCTQIGSAGSNNDEVREIFRKTIGGCRKLGKIAAFIGLRDSATAPLGQVGLEPHQCAGRLVAYQIQLSRSQTGIADLGRQTVGDVLVEGKRSGIGGHGICAGKLTSR